LASGIELTRKLVTGGIDKHAWKYNRAQEHQAMAPMLAAVTTLNAIADIRARLRV